MGIEVRGLTKTFGSFVALKDVSLNVASGELYALLGPSGSGKTTLLGILGGFIQPSSGSVHFGDRDVTFLPPHKRDIGVVFQNYALFPHMSVAENIGFPLSVRGMSSAEMNTRIERALDMVQLKGFGSRRPAQLSGGQQQRIAVARALVFEPKLILMDEPLGALDKQLREQMQLEIRSLHQRLDVTMVYVTHDQSEALTMSDRIAVFHRGKIQQLDVPERIYEAPLNAFVARFIGENNRLDGVLESADSARCTVRLADDTCIDGSLAESLAPGTPVTMSLRPERVQIRSAAHTMPAAEGSRLEGALREVIYLGDHVRLRVALSDNGEFMVKRPISETHALPAIGDVVTLAWAPEHCRAFARENVRP